MDEHSTVEDVLPLSPLQQGLLFHALFDEGAQDVYTMQFVVELEGPLDAVRLREAAEALLARHANLRSGFDSEDLDEPVQVVLRDVAVPWTETDLSTMDPEAQETRVAELAEADRVARFDLMSPPLLRFTLARTSQHRHLLVMSNHHLLLDGWSIPLLVRELLALYASGADAPSLPAVRPYRDFLAWLASRDREAAAEAWSDALAGVTEPTLLARGGVTSTAVVPDVVTLRLPEELTTRLRELAQSRRLTVNTVVQGLWGLLLSRLTGRDDVVFGATVSGRPADLPGVEAMIGLFINTVPVRATLDPGEPVSQALHRLQDEQSRLMDFHYLGLTEIQRSAGVSGGRGAGELFDTLIVYENYPLDTDAVTRASGDTGVRVAGWKASGGTHYPLTLAVFDERQLTVAFEFRPDAFPRETVEALSRRFSRLVEQAVEDLEQPLARLDVLLPEEREELLSRGTGARLSPPHATLPEALEEHAARTPDATAVVSGNDVLSFAELNQRANRLARLLVERGAGAERIVAVALPPGAETIVALLAVLKSGATYLPIDPGWPAERIGVVLADAQPVLLVTAGAFDGHDVETVRLDDSGTTAQIDGRAGADLAPADRGPLLPEHPAYVIYTSGSTGQPKAVAVPHRAIVNLLASHRAALFDPAASAAGGRPLRVGHAWPTAFDASWQPTLWMFAGHELHLVPTEVRRDPALLREFLTENGIEFIELSPSLLGEVASETPWRGSLKVLGVGGEAVPPQLWNGLRAEEDLTVHNLYGPTECTVDATACDLSWSDRPSIGRPVGGARAYVLDRHLNLVPPGVEGELYIAGEGLARGYLGQPAATASRFVANPHAERPGERLYRTGDIARWTSEGFIECLGRVDDQVKIRGFRVDPGEIEGVLLRHDEVERAAVIAREDSPGVRRLVAYVIPARDDQDVEERSTLTAALREHTAERLPDYMVPAAVILVDRFPLNHNEKLDVTALPAPDWASRTSTQPPRNAAEKDLAGLFGEVLGVESVGVHDNFFSLGGDSILSMRLVSRARSSGLTLSPRDVFERPTVAELARGAKASQPSAPDGSGAGAVPLTPALAWLVSEGGPFAGTCQARVVPLPSDVDFAVVERGVRAVLDRHEVLRSAFTWDADGSWRLHVPERDAVSAEVRRVRADGGHSEVREVEKTVFDEIAAELDPRAEMARFVLFETAAGQPDRLMVVLRHEVVDGMSWGIVLSDLAHSWDEPRPDTPAATGARGTPFRQWALGLRSEAQTPGRVAELGLWQGLLSGPDPILGAGPRDSATDTMATVRDMRTELAPEVADSLLKLPETHGGTVHDVLLTALAVAVAEWRRTRGWAGEESSVLLSVQRHGREEQVVPGADLSGTVGWFSTAHPVRLDPGRSTTGTMLGRVREQLAELPGNGIGYGLLRYLNADTAAELSGLGEPQIQFNYLGRSTGGGDDGHAATAPEMPVPHSLLVEARIRPEDSGPVLETFWRWPERVLTPDDIRSLSESWAAAADLLRKGDLR